MSSACRLLRCHMKPKMYTRVWKTANTWQEVQYEEIMYNSKILHTKMLVKNHLHLKINCKRYRKLSIFLLNLLALYLMQFFIYLSSWRVVVTKYKHQFFFILMISRTLNLTPFFLIVTKMKTGEYTYIKDNREILYSSSTRFPCPSILITGNTFKDLPWPPLHKRKWD